MQLCSVSSTHLLCLPTGSIHFSLYFILRSSRLLHSLLWFQHQAFSLVFFFFFKSLCYSNALLLFLMIISFSSSVTFSSKMQAVLSFSLPCQWYTPLLLLQPFICIHDYLGIFDIASQSDLESFYFKSLISSLICVYPQEEEGVEFNGSFSRYPNL